jgi:dTDP-4-amino-4,6-dideoxygalactose transaminase
MPITSRDLLVFAARKLLTSFDNLDRQNNEIRKNLSVELKKILSFRDFFEIENYQNKFENDFAKFCDKKFSVGTSSGTAALQCALLACGIGPGDEVITTTNTNIATVVAIENTGAKPVLVDINEKNYLIDEEEIEKKITRLTKAIIPVHLYGDVCEMDRINEIAKNHGIEVIEDSSQAHGVAYNGKKVPISDIGCFSFYTNKLIGGFGNGGIVVTNSKEVIEKIKPLLDSEINFDNEFMLKSRRTPCNLDAIQIAFIRAKMPFYEKWMNKRRHIAKLYSEILQGTEILLPEENKKVRHGFYRYVIRVKKRDQLKKFLLRNRIQTDIHYPYLVHTAKAFLHLGYKRGDFPVAEQCQKEFLSLPINPWYNDEEIIKIANAVKRFAAKNGN